MSQPTAKYELGQVFWNSKRKSYFLITNRKYISRLPKGSKSKIADGETEIWEWLYDCLSLNGEPIFRRYYENRLNKEMRIANHNDQYIQDLIKLYHLEKQA